MRKGLLFPGFLALALGVTTAQAQLYTYTNDPGGAPAAVAANTTASSLTRVNGALPTTGCPDGFNSNRFSESTIYATFRPAVEFSLGPNTGYQINISSLSVDARRNNKGPVTWRLAYSLDGGASWIDNGSDFTVSATACATANTLTWDMPDFAMLTPIYVRIYAFSASSNFNGIATIEHVTLGGFVTFADVDDDGYTSDVDCDDFNPAVNPGASEVCNAIDDDCDGTADDGLTFLNYYTDADGDGFGSSAVAPVSSCLPVAGSVTNNGDCNDADAAVNPDVAEICNGLDEDCDGSVDDGVLLTFYADADGDSFGDPAVFTEACSAPAGFVVAGTDCNDAVNTIYPGAPEICSNGIDEDCDGVADLTAAIEAAGPTTFCLGGSVTLNSTTAGASLSFQWQKNGNPIAGATNSSYVVTTQGNYRCVVSKPTCTSTSSPISVTVNLNPNATIAALDGLDLCGKSFVRLRGNNGTGLSYQWYLNGSPIAGATAQVYYATVVGDYRLQVTNAAGCSTISAATVVFTSCRMADAADDAQVVLLPNPSRGTFKLQMTMAQEVNADAHVQILNMTGQMVQSFNTEVAAGVLNTTIDMTPVAGAYLVLVQVNGAVYTERIMIAE